MEDQLRVLKRVLLEDASLQRMLEDVRIREKICLDGSERLWRDERFLTMLEFYQQWKILSRVVDTDRVDIPEKYNAVKHRLSNRNEITDCLLDIICDGNRVFLVNGVMKFPDRVSLWVLINEILINEDYYFETNTDSPRILDCGSHFGLAVYYFKSLYPKAVVIGFEPVPTLCELALENLTRNGYQDVKILPYALADTNHHATFLVSETDSMAGSLTERRRIIGDNVTEIEVRCRRLSEFLREPVHFLKLDIEGSEDVVLTEAGELLKNVQHIFCEYHHGAGLDTERLGRTLLLLDENGFDVQVGKSFSSQRGTERRPMTFADRPYSAVIWAKNKSWLY